MIIRMKSETALNIFIAMSALLLPYVSFEPAPIDFALIAAAIIFTFKCGQLRKGALMISIVYLTFYFASGLFSAAKGQQNDIKFVRYYIVEIFLTLTTLYAYSIFKEYPSIAKSFLKYYCIGAVVSCSVIAIVYYAVPSYHEIYRDSALIRIKGFFKDPNVLGPYLIFPALMLLFAPKRVDLSSYWRFGVLPILLILFLAYSRASLGSFIVSAIVLYFFSAVSGIKKQNAILSVAAICALILLLPGQMDRVESVFSSLENFRNRMALQSYDQSRFFDIKNAFNVGASKLFGLGPASYETMFNALSPHNLFVAKLVDGGWVPALIISWFILFPVYISMKHYLKTRDEIYLVIFCVFIAHSMMAMIINPHHWRHLLLLSAFTFAIPRTQYQDMHRTQLNTGGTKNETGS